MGIGIVGYFWFEWERLKNMKPALSAFRSPDLVASTLINSSVVEICTCLGLLATSYYFAFQYEIVIMELLVSIALGSSANLML